MAVVFLDITAGDDPNGAILTTLDDSDIAAFEMRCGENELGSGSFTIRRDHPDATEANLATGNYVKVRIPLIQAEPVFGFWLDEHDDTLISSDEEGGETLMRGGPGTLFILRHASLLNDIHVPAQVNRGNRDVPGYWTWVGEPYGAILQRLLEEGRLEPGTPLTDVTDDFTRADDSDSNPWPDITDTFQVPIGSDGLSVYRSLVESGELFVRVTPDLLVHAYQTRGVDRTSATYAAGKVRFVKGENILTGLDRQGHGTLKATHAIVIGDGGVYRQVVDPAYVSGPGRWVTVNYDESDDTALLDKVGLEAIRKRNAEQESLELEFLAGDDEATGLYLPFQHFNTGDIISLDTGSDPWDYADADFRVAGFRVVLGEASDDSTDTLEARSLRWIAEIGAGSTSGGMGAGTGNGKCCPGLKLCHDDEGGILEDYLSRSVTPGDQVDLGTTDLGGYTYEWGSFGDSGEAGIVGGVLVLQGPASGEGPFTHILTLAPAFDLTEVGAMTRFDTRFRTSVIIDPVLESTSLEITPEGGAGSTSIEMLFSNTDGYFRINGGAGAVTADAAPEPNMVVKTDWVADTWYRVAIVADGLDARVKLWAEPAAEPGTYLIADNVAFPWDPLDGGWIVIQAGFDNNTETTYDHTVEIDYLDPQPRASSTCIVGGPNATSGDTEESCGHKAAPCNHDHAYTSAQVSHGAGTVEDALDAAASAAPNSATYLVGAAHAGLTSEIVVGTTPNGELGGTWGAITVDTTHSGTSHTGAASAAVTTHVGLSDPHAQYRLEADNHSHASSGAQGGTVAHSALTGLTSGDDHTQYQKESEKGAASGYASLDGSTKVPIAEVPTGTSGTTVALGNHTHGGGAHTHVDSETPAGTIDGVNAAFTLAATPSSGTLHLYKNGLRQRAGSGNDYTLATNTITYEAGNLPLTGDSHVCDYVT